ncbi:MAG TPA: transcription antitermination factor NusB [Sedimentisphaerales bacterium]|jgi:16S rRNA (cytosine967-C5)-methyltransferase|nr:transcription antitermination factor NusB [Sedimentisphaerales bacterium]HNU30554.1 transcription antitermination factor NusB [Sedimentisphaerales bacterium]
MTAGSLKSARVIAAQVLHRFDPTRDYAGRLLDPLLDQTDQKQRATDLVYGVIRNRNALDAAIATFSGRPVARIDARLLSILRIAAYELVYSPATQVYSIVDEAVNSVGTSGGRKQSGFVNAVLRQIVRHIADRQADLAGAHARRTLPQTPQSGCEFDTDFLPDPTTSTAAWLSLCFSLPAWLVDEWLDEFGSERTRDICLACNRRPGLYLRVNPLRTTGDDLLSRFRAAGVQAEPVRSDAVRRFSSSREEDMPLRAHCEEASPDRAVQVADMIRITGPHAVTQLPGFAEGLFTIQDLSASQAVRILDPQPGWAILDLCAAPGGKTVQIAEMSRGAASVTATDIDPERLERVRENLARVGLKSVKIVPHAQLEQDQAGPFDAILLDVPCSNTGVLARRVEARFRVTAQAVQEIATIQQGLLERAATLVKPSGRIGYSTCSIERRENQDMIRAFLASHSEFELASESLLLPTTGPFDHDGGYVALLVRR